VLAASAAFSAGGRADMFPIESCASPAQSICSVQSDPTQNQLSRTEKDNSANAGSTGVDERQANSPIGASDRRQVAGSASSRGDGGDRGGGNR
jgi:hypothetical protein